MISIVKYQISKEELLLYKDILETINKNYKNRHHFQNKRAIISSKRKGD